MRPKTRLDPVIKLEEQKEERRLHEMAAARRQVKSARDALAHAQEAARKDQRRLASAVDWQLAEVAHTRALQDVRTAEHEVKAASEAAGLSRDRYAEAHARAEALRRVAAARVDEIVTARDKAEHRELDEIGVQRFNRRTPAS
jgi:flagellar export protein FliJ